MLRGCWRYPPVGVGIAQTIPSTFWTLHRTERYTIRWSKKRMHRCHRGGRDGTGGYGRRGQRRRRQWRRRHTTPLPGDSFFSAARAGREQHGRLQRHRRSGRGRPRLFAPLLPPLRFLGPLCWRGQERPVDFLLMRRRRRFLRLLLLHDQVVLIIHQRTRKGKYMWISRSGGREVLQPRHPPLRPRSRKQWGKQVVPIPDVFPCLLLVIRNEWQERICRTRLRVHRTTPIQNGKGRYGGRKGRHATRSTHPMTTLLFRCYTLPRKTIVHGGKARRTRR